MFVFGISSKEQRLLEDLREHAKGLELATSVLNLKKQINELEIEKSKLKEQHEKEERELRHMIGLEKKRQEFEIEQSKRETKLTVQQENLAADKKRFEDQMKFHETRFTEEVSYLKEMIGNVLERLPNVSAAFETKRGKKHKLL